MRTLTAGKWATEVEIFGAASLLQTDIMLWLPRGDWALFERTVLNSPDGGFEEVREGEMVERERRRRERREKAIIQERALIERERRRERREKRKREIETRYRNKINCREMRNRDYLDHYHYCYNYYYYYYNNNNNCGNYYNDDDYDDNDDNYYHYHYNYYNFYYYY